MISRRAFLARSAASAAAFTVIPSRLVGADESRSPNSRLALAGVGVGGVGFGQLQECAEAGFQIVALCDVDEFKNADWEKIRDELYRGPGA